MALARPRLTEDEFMRLPDDGRKYELVDGEAKEVSTGVRHDEIVALLIFLLFPFTKGRGVLCASQAGFRMVNGNVRSPDVSFTLKERLPDGKAPVGFGDAAPDLCIEIISPSEDQADMARKVVEYFASGAQEVWHLYPETQSLTVFHSPTDSLIYGPDAEIESPNLLPGFRSRITELFNIK